MTIVTALDNQHQDTVLLRSLDDPHLVGRCDVATLQLPIKAQTAIDDTLPLYQLIEESEKIVVQKSVPFTEPELAYAQHVWNEELPRLQEAVNMNFTASDPLFARALSQIRTQLVDLVANATAGTPLSELPREELVDAAVDTYIGTQYNTTIHATNGPTAIGDRAKAKSEGLSVAVDDLRAKVEAVTPELGAVVKKARRPLRLSWVGRSTEGCA